jgi:two-component system sensor histidine kinase DctS
LLQDIKARPELQAMGTERRLLKRDGDTIEVLLHYAPLALANGTTIGWICSTLDVTDRRKAERLALRQQEVLEASARLIAVGEVASTLAHELNQPLGALSSFSNGLLNRLEMGNITLEEVSPVVARIEKMAQKAGRIIQRVNAFARRQEMTRQPLDLLAFVKRVSQSIHLSGNVELDCELPDLQHVLAADALLLEHALNNLVLNAVEWAAPHATDFGKVRIRIAHAELHTGVTVEDSGPGVPPDKRGGIFDAFTSHKAGGMGMGLSICRSIVEAHHGRIEVSQSEALGGAQFTLWLPNNT